MKVNPHEIIVTTREDSNQPRVVQFLDLYALRDDITSMMYLWDTNCYYVNVGSRTFIINGGRKLSFGSLGPCRILYRRRNRRTFAIDGKDGGPEKTTLWLLGLEERAGEKKIILIISEDGMAWQWANKL